MAMIDPNGHSWFALLMATATHPSEWPAWVKQALGAGIVVLITSFTGTSLALWRDQAILAEKVVGVQTAGELGRKLLQEQIFRNDREIADIRLSAQRAHERISTHIDGHAPRPAQK